MVALKSLRQHLQLASRKKSLATRHHLTHAQKAVLTDVPSVAVMASVAAVTAAVVVAIVAKAAAPKDGQKGVLMVVRKAVPKTAMTAVAMAGAASVGSATLKRLQKVRVRSVRSVRNVRQARCAVKRYVTTAVQTRQTVAMGSNATTAALKTVICANPALMVRAVSAPAANGATVQSAVTAFRATLQNRTLRWPTRPPWPLPSVAVMVSSPCQIALPQMRAAMKAVVSGATAMDAATTAAVNAAKVITRVRKARVHSTLKQRRQ